MVEDTGTPCPKWAGSKDGEHRPMTPFATVEPSDGGFYLVVKAVCGRCYQVGTMSRVWHMTTPIRWQDRRPSPRAATLALPAPGVDAG